MRKFQLMQDTGIVRQYGRLCSFLLPVTCTECKWRGKRKAQFAVNLRKIFGVKEALSHASGETDYKSCPHCNHNVIYCWPKVRDPKLHPAHGDVLLRRNGGASETRHVIDRNLGGDVFYRTGLKGYGSRQDCTRLGWEIWARDAVVVEIGEPEGVLV